MRALMYDEFGGPLSLRNVPDPSPPVGGVVVRVAATGICRSDWHGWQGHDPDIRVFPHVPGHEFAGTVAEVGQGVTGWSVGDRVTVPFVNACGLCAQCMEGNHQVCAAQRQPGFTHWGSFAELVTIDAADVNLVALPNNLAAASAASLGCRYATSYRAVVSVGRVQPGELVVIHGCGGVGLAAVQVAVALGAQVVAVDTNPAAVELAHSFGAVDVAYEGRAHVSIDAVGDPRVAEASIASLRPRGRHVQVGLLPGEQPVIWMNQVVAKELQLLGSHGMAAHEYPSMLEMVADGRLRPDLLVARTVPLEDAGPALAEVGATAGVTVVQVQ